MRSLLKRVRLELEHPQGFSELFALGKSRSPVVVVALAVEAYGFADQQRVGNHGDGHFRERLQGTVRAGDRDFEDGLGHVIYYRRGMSPWDDKEMKRSLKLSL